MHSRPPSGRTWPPPVAITSLQLLKHRAGIRTRRDSSGLCKEDVETHRKHGDKSIRSSDWEPSHLGSPAAYESMCIHGDNADSTFLAVTTSDGTHTPAGTEPTPAELPLWRYSPDEVFEHLETSPRDLTREQASPRFRRGVPALDAYRDRAPGRRLRVRRVPAPALAGGSPAAAYGRPEASAAARPTGLARSLCRSARRWSPKAGACPAIGDSAS